MKSRGFTLIEMLIVLAIIAILAGVIFIGLGTRRGAARDTRRIADIKTIQGALELYYQANQAYPSAADLTDLTPTYTANVPQDPKPDVDYYYRYAPDTGTSPTNQGYVLGARLEVTDNPIFDDSFTGSTFSVSGNVIGFICGNPIYCVTF